MYRLLHLSYFLFSTSLWSDYGVIMSSRIECRLLFAGCGGWVELFASLSRRKRALRSRKELVVAVAEPNSFGSPPGSGLLGKPVGGT